MDEQRYRYCGYRVEYMRTICIRPHGHSDAHELVGMESHEGDAVISSLNMDRLLEGRGKFPVYP